VSLHVAAIQMTSGADPAENLRSAERLVRSAAEAGAQYIQLPECLNYLGPPSGNLEVAEELPGTTTRALGALAREYGVHVHAGSLLVRGEITGMCANVSVLLGPGGEIVGSYAKIHLFDIDVPDQVQEQESASIIPGAELVTLPVADLTLGLRVRTLGGSPAGTRDREPRLRRCRRAGGRHAGGIRLLRTLDDHRPVG
jgi:predicted amidohydrolase